MSGDLAAFLRVRPLAVGAVRLSAEPLAPEEIRHGAFVRDVLPAKARALAAELLAAADEAERNERALTPDA